MHLLNLLNLEILGEMTLGKKQNSPAVFIHWFKYIHIHISTVSAVMHGSDIVSLFFLGSMDNTVRLWDATKAFDDLETDDFTAATGHIHLQDNSQELLLGTYMSKSTPVTHLHFTRRNLLLAAGAYNP